MLLAGKADGLLELVILVFRAIRMLASGGAGGGVILGVLGVAVVGGLLWWVGQSGGEA